MSDSVVSVVVSVALTCVDLTDDVTRVVVTVFAASVVEILLLEESPQAGLKRFITTNRYINCRCLGCRFNQYEVFMMC